jgi:2-aminoethylphosphonate dioxygenase
MNMLDEAQRAQWRQQGHLLLEQHLDAAQRTELATWVAELAQWPETPGKWMKWYERVAGRRQLCRIEDFVPYHAGFADLLEGAQFAAILQELCGEPAVLFKEKINFKLPGGAGFQPHQDAPAFTTFGQRYHVTMMISVDATTRQNGCLEVVDGFHGAGLLPQASDGTLDPAWAAAQAWKPIETRPGDVLFFDSCVPHRSGPNHSTAARAALYVTYNRASEGDRRREYFARKRAAFPPECERLSGVDYAAGASVYNLGNPIT